MRRRSNTKLERGADRVIYSMLGFGKAVFVIVVCFLLIWFCYALVVGQ